jgi:predicted site-specific integrase-resolvase
MGNTDTQQDTGLLGMSVAAAAVELGISEPTAYRWVETGKLTRLAGIVGTIIIVDAASVAALKAHETEASQS